MDNHIFGTDGVRGLANCYPMTAEIALRLGRASAHVLKVKHISPTVVIGKDTRLSGYMFENALASGFCSMGVDVWLVGPLPTPAISFLTRSMRCGAGVMISASHNSYEDNGIKIFSSDGLKLPNDIQHEIEDAMFSEELKNVTPTHEEIGRITRIEDAMGRYIEYVKSTFPRDITLSGLKIALDVANGATYKVAPKTFFELGAEVVTTADRPNGLNINDKCGSTCPQRIQRLVAETKADIGIAFDGDGDRVIMVDKNGFLYDGDRILAIAADYLKRQERLSQNTVVGTVMSNLGLERFIHSLDCQFIRTPVGDRCILKELLDGGYNLGGEQSGHIIFSDYSRSGDGIISALFVLKVLMHENKELSDYRNIIDDYPQIILNVPVKKKVDLSDNSAISEIIESVTTKLGNAGRVLVRNSGTELKTRIMIEGDDEILIKSYANDIAEVVTRELG